MSELEISYQLILKDLRRGHRPRPVLSTPQLENIEQTWFKALQSPIPCRKTLRSVFCILENTQTLDDRFDSLFRKTFEHENIEGKTLVFALGSFHRQVIDRCEKKGERPPGEIVNHLRNLLKHSNPEVVEWSLRTIERIGTMGLSLKEEVRKTSPGFFEALFNRHKRTSRTIVAFLEKRWSKR